LYVTVPNRALAESIGHALIEEKLAACINILGEITSIYRWEGKINEGTEVAMLVKTTTENAIQTTQRITSLHPYECPAILVLPVNGGFMPFLNWIAQETSA
jgi:periplasmic divalent cation tolerance protein